MPIQPNRDKSVQSLIFGARNTTTNDNNEHSSSYWLYSGHADGSICKWDLSVVPHRLVARTKAEKTLVPSNDENDKYELFLDVQGMLIESTSDILYSWSRDCILRYRCAKTLKTLCRLELAHVPITIVSGKYKSKSVLYIGTIRGEILILNPSTRKQLGKFRFILVARIIFHRCASLLESKSCIPYIFFFLINIYKNFITNC